MRTAEKNTNGAWRRGRDGRSGRRVRDAKPVSSECSAHHGYAVPGGAAPVRPGEASITAIRRGAAEGRRRVTVIGAAQSHASSPTPIWLSALTAAQCLATGNGRHHDVRWDCAAGRAVYTNAGDATETIHPLGVSLEGGQTLSVYWGPGETEYTMEVYGQNACE